MNFGASLPRHKGLKFEKEMEVFCCYIFSRKFFFAKFPNPWELIYNNVSKCMWGIQASWFNFFFDFIFVLFSGASSNKKGKPSQLFFFEHVASSYQHLIFGQIFGYKNDSPMALSRLMDGFSIGKKNAGRFPRDRSGLVGETGCLFSC